MPNRQVLPSRDAEHLFQVGDQDFILLFGSAERLFASHSVTIDGVFAVPLEYGGRSACTYDGGLHHQTETAQHSWRLPCSLKELLNFCEEEGYGELPNEPLVGWMVGRVELNRHRAAWEWLDAIAEKLFEVESADLKRLEIEVYESSECRAPPRNLRDLLAWCDGDDIGQARANQPQNAQITALVLDKVRTLSGEIHSDPACTPLHVNTRRAYEDVIRLLENAPGVLSKASQESFWRTETSANLTKLCR